MEYYLIGAFNLEEALYKRKGCWKRKDLVECPEILKYTREIEGNTIFYINNMQCCVFVTKYGDFSCKEEMQKDYDSDAENSIYQSCYNELLENIKKKYNAVKVDVSWIMPFIAKGTLQISSSFVEVASGVDEETLEYVALIDCSMIYQVINVMSNFYKNLSTKEELDRFEQYQLSFFVQTINLLKNPAYYLTNSKEIELYEKLYQEWELTDQINIVSELSEKTMQLFSFLATYKKKNKINLVEFFLPYISFVLSYNSIIEITIFFVPQLSDVIEIVVKAVLLVGFGVTCISLVRALLAINKMNERFAAKTCEK